MTKTAMTKNVMFLDEIKEKYSQVHEKMKFVMKVSELTGLNVFSVKNHHFGNFKIPMKYRKPYLKLLNDEINKQNKEYLEKPKKL